MFSLVAPAIWWAHAAITFDGLLTAVPECLVATAVIQPLHLCAIIILQDDALSIVVGSI